jgi:hypothetical protein
MIGSGWNWFEIELLNSAARIHNQQEAMIMCLDIN